MELIKNNGRAKVFNENNGSRSNYYMRKLVKRIDLAPVPFFCIYLW